jgi:Tol biopolymer transport system component
MTDDRFSPRLPELMQELAGGDEGYIDDILAKTARTRQRPAWTFAAHWLRTPTALDSLPAYRNRLIAVFLLVALLALLLASAAFFGSRRPALSTSQTHNGWIAVSANPGGGGGEFGDIYLLQNGSPARMIIGSSGDGVGQACPMFSPDGHQIAYGEGRQSLQPGDDPLRGRASVAERAIVVVGLDDHGDASFPRVRIPLPAVPGEMACPQWSPDGREVATRVDSELWVADVASGHATVFQGMVAPWGQQEFAWSRDGTQIAVSGPGQIQLVPVNGGPATAIQISGNTPGSLGWLSGDKRIVYIEPDQPGDGQSVHVIGADGTGDLQLSPTSNTFQLTFYDAVVSPDGNRIAYKEHTALCTTDGCDNNYPERLLTVNPDGSDEVDVAIPTGFGVSSMQWSPDGEQLLLGSIDGLVSAGVAPRSASTVHTQGELNLEWSPSEFTWQPVYR